MRVSVSDAACIVSSDLQTEPVGESSMRTNNILNFNVGLDKATHIDILTIQLCPLKFIMGPAKIFVGLFEHEEVNADSLVKFSDTCSEFEQTVARAENYLLSAPNNQRNSVLQFVNAVRNFDQDNKKKIIIWMTRAVFYLCSNCMDSEKKYTVERIADFARCHPLFINAPMLNQWLAFKKFEKENGDAILGVNGVTL